MGLVISLLVTFWVGYLIYKKYKAITGVVFRRYVLMFTAVILGYGQILPLKRYRLVLFDAMNLLKQLFKLNVAKLGLNIMLLVRLHDIWTRLVLPCFGSFNDQTSMALKSPYLVLSGTWVVGMLIGLCINSASGLVMLLMVTMFPILVD